MLGCTSILCVLFRMFCIILGCFQFVIFIAAALVGDDVVFGSFVFDVENCSYNLRSHTTIPMNETGWNQLFAACCYLADREFSFLQLVALQSNVITLLGRQICNQPR